jgi:hypothetical protein
MQRGPRILVGHYKSGFAGSEIGCGKIKPEQQDVAIS